MSTALRAGEKLRARVIRGSCVGSGLCTELAPRVFRFDDDGKAHAGPITDADRDRARDAALACPARAILLLRIERNGTRSIQ